MEGERQAGLRLSAENATARVLMAGESVDDVVPGVLAAICENLGWMVGLLWRPESAGADLTVSASWAEPAADVGGFLNACLAAAIPPGDGLPGRVWARGEVAWVRDVGETPDFVRVEAARAAGLRGAIAVPVALRGESYGVLEFFTRDVLDADPELLETLVAVGCQFGLFIGRRRAESALRASEARLRFQAEAGRLLASSLDYETTLDTLAGLSVPVLGDWCFIHTVLDGADGEDVLVCVARAVPDHQKAAGDAFEALLSGPAASHLRNALNGDEPILIRAADAGPPLDPERPQATDVQAFLIVPLRARGRPLGILTLALIGEREPEDADVRLATELAHRAALAIDNARLYREAEEGNRAKADFLAVVSHELRTPLNAIIGYADLMASGISGDLNETQARQIDRIKLGSGHLARIIDEILAFARVEAGKETLDVEPTDLARVAREAVAVLEPAARDDGIELRVVGSEAGPVLYTDAGKVRQILVNLLSNAVKFTNEGHVEVRVRAVDRGAVLEVSDTGIGIPPDQRRRIFEPFRQVQSPNTRTSGGTGLGLSVSQHMAGLLGGTITVASEPGRGSTFIVRLPDRAPEGGR